VGTKIKNKRINRDVYKKTSTDRMRLGMNSKKEVKKGRLGKKGHDVLVFVFTEKKKKKKKNKKKKKKKLAGKGEGYYQSHFGGFKKSNTRIHP